jgi:hypothetical protein
MVEQSCSTHGGQKTESARGKGQEQDLPFKGALPVIHFLQLGSFTIANSSVD